MSGPWRWTLLALAVAVCVHLAFVWATPRVLMRVAMRKLAEQAGTNVAAYPPRADEDARAIVRPSPDLLYASCVFDLRDGPVRLAADVPDAYWSLSLYAADTDDFFIVNDRSADAPRVELVLVRAGDAAAAPAGARVVESPSSRGVALVRTLVDRDEREPALDAVRRSFRCGRP
ncbi:MAG: DUF1254 domain-containing protein [Proteobacteria bacterium]|nr:MAG: DUF1254 domain-containing protein [Pseudomonadota bacterium]